MGKCSVDNCENKEMARSFWDGKAFCTAHYDEMILSELFSQYKDWEADTPPEDRFKYLFGRVYDEDYFENIGEGMLSNARIRDRGFNYTKTEKGCTFEITRHLNAWEGRGKRENIVEKWEADFDKMTFLRVSTRKFKKGDFDG